MNVAIENQNESGTLTLEEAAKRAKSFSSKMGAHLSVNKSGNIFVRHPSFQCWSVDKEKTYTAGLNIDREILRAICSNPLLQQEILAFTDLVPNKAGMSEKEIAAVAALYKKEKKSK